MRHGRLAAAGVLPHGRPYEPWLAQLLATAETVEPAAGPAPACSVEEVETVRRWLTSPGVRLVSGTWRSGYPSAARHVR